jgi:hypothetical protein
MLSTNTQESRVRWWTRALTVIALAVVAVLSTWLSPTPPPTGGRSGDQRFFRPGSVSTGAGTGAIVETRQS